MKTIQEQYNKFLDGTLTKDHLLAEIRKDAGLKSFITNLMTFNDTIKTLKNKGIISEAKKKVTTLTLDTANPYEVKKGLDYELGLCYTASPATPLPMAEILKAQNKVLKNLAKDANYYTHKLAEIKPSLDDKISTAWVPVKKEFNDKKNAMKVVKKADKANVKDTLGKKERKKGTTPKGVKVMGTMPKKQKGVQIMKVPGKAKTIKLREGKERANKIVTELFRGGFFGGKKNEPSQPTFKGKVDPSIALAIASGYTHEDLNRIGQQPFDNFRDIVRACLEYIPRQYQDQFKRSCERAYGMQENIPASTSNVVPFTDLKPGQQVSDDSGKSYKILAIGNYDDLRAYDTNGVFNKFLSSDPQGIDGNQLVAIKGPSGTSVRVYGTGGVYAYNEGMEDEGRGYDDGEDSGSHNEKDGGSVISTYNEGIDDDYTDPNMKNAARNYLNAKKQNIDKELSNLSEFETEEEPNPDDDYPTHGQSHEIAVIKHNSALRHFAERNHINKFGKSQPETKIAPDGSVIYTQIPGWGGFVTKHDQNGNVTKELSKPLPEMNENKTKIKMKTDFDRMLDKILREDASALGNNIPTKSIPADETEKAEAKAAILVSIAKAGLQQHVNLDKDIVVREGHIWVNVVLGDGILNKEQMKALSSDGNFVGVNPVDTDTLTLVFKKA